MSDNKKVYKKRLIKFVMGLEKESTTMLKVPRCINPERNWKLHPRSGYNLCTFPDSKNCLYRTEVLTLKVCTYEEAKKSEESDR